MDDHTKRLLERMHALLDELRSVASQLASQGIDPSSGFYTADLLLPRLQEAIALAHRKGHYLSVIFFGLDDPHQRLGALQERQSDLVIRELGTRVAAESRDSDAYFRYGPAEFVALLPATPLEGARVSAERIQRVIASRPFLDGSLVLSASFGVAAYPLHGTNEQTILDAATRAYREAQRAGMGQVVLADSDDKPALSDWKTGIYGALGKTRNGSRP